LVFVCNQRRVWHTSSGSLTGHLQQRDHRGPASQRQLSSSSSPCSVLLC
jgi:hypothetical protein